MFGVPALVLALYDASNILPLRTDNAIVLVPLAVARPARSSDRGLAARPPPNRKDPSLLRRTRRRTHNATNPDQRRHPGHPQSLTKQPPPTPKPQNPKRTPGHQDTKGNQHTRTPGQPAAPSTPGQPAHQGAHRTVGVWGGSPPRQICEVPLVRAFCGQGDPGSERVTGIEPALSAWEPHKIT